MKALSARKTIAAMLRAGVVPVEPYESALSPWRCRCTTCGQEVLTRYNSIQNGQGACVWCAGRRVGAEHAIAVMRKAGLDPLGPYPGSHAIWPCRCLDCGRDVRPRYHAVNQGVRGCGYCAGKRVDHEAAEAVMLAAGVEPIVSFPGVNVPWLCRCRSCGREVSPRLSGIRQGQGGCGYCAGNLVDMEEAATVMRAAGLEPLDSYPGGNKRPWRCRCMTCDREVTPSYNTVQGGGGGCAWCAGIKVDPDAAAAFMVAAGVQPLEAYPGANSRWRCRCLRCAREIRPSYGSVRSGHHGCTWCARGSVVPREAAEAMRAAGLEPLEDYPGLTKRWRCRCLKCGSEVAPRYDTVVLRAQGGCLHCAKQCPPSCPCRVPAL